NGAMYANGYSGQAFSFNGNQSAVQMSNTALNGAYSALTMSAWVNPTAHGHDQTNTWGSTILSRTETDGFALRVKDGFVQADLRLTSGDKTVTFPGQATALPLGAWSYIAVTYNGSQITAYVNGQSIGSVSASGTVRNSANSNTSLT